LLKAGDNGAVDHDLRAVMGHFCTGVAIVTGCNDWQSAGFVAQSVQSISLNPPLVSCRIEIEHEAGDHTIVLGRVLDLGVRLPDAKPLLFFRGRYGSFLENSA
jgi:flavin reductase (DIM6/NTAB) family NADH-FMN oxidoreductase RutF